MPPPSCQLTTTCTAALPPPVVQGGFARPAPVPKMVADFVQFLYRHIRERNINEVFIMYRWGASLVMQGWVSGGEWSADSAAS